MVMKRNQSSVDEFDVIAVAEFIVFECRFGDFFSVEG